MHRRIGMLVAVVPLAVTACTAPRDTPGGQATSRPLKGQRLGPHEHLDTFWLAWVAFHPETRVMR